ncbi:serine/threonine protein kinase [Phycicoccus sp. MAQZ13P-2]|uniref:serine/threonine-protein kinase n=1 Tax=Phycicoccus mangrovi TaxID=2840470 RepID=UPI001C006034|nr:serine/threonine-protein kinase [Phycicoccus mangrovi]MBT9258026.1 serine/threonine protein kinase [Phycicoccus mangrovi]MBT9276010.1 serine/threonine protein kinase [Phycicoccus mangrovi]
MTPADAPVIPGLTFVRPLGSGGYADVYLYEQQSPRMNVAVKVLKRQGLTASIRRQFVDEANTMAQLADHPYIVQVFRSEQTADGGAYLVMKYYPPPNLAQRAKAERLTVEEVLRTGIQLASAVETAHRAGIVHRDIKPANVLVSQYGQPGLTDFGIAGRGGHAEDVDEDVGVSVPWSAPEVLYGMSNGDARSDVYSLAATLWHLLVGRSPFEQPGGDNSAYALMPRIRATPVPATGRADVPVSLERLLAHAMAKSPDGRPQSAIELARGLQAVEREQRLAPTAVVVLDEQGNTTVAESPAARGGDDHDRTSIRAVSVPAPAAPAPTAAHPDDDEDDDAPATVSGGVVLGVLAVLVAVTVGVVVWALGRGDDEVAPTPTAAGTLTRTAAPSRAVDYPEQPAIDARGSGSGVTFTWNYVGAETGDFFRIRLADTEGGVADAEIITVKDGPRYTAKAGSGQTVCAQVQVSRSSGVTSPLSPVRCETAP